MTLTASGIVVDVSGRDVARVDEFTLRTNDGRQLEFSVETLSLDGGGKPAPHLREHLASGEPITVEYVVDGQRQLAMRYYDATPTDAPATSEPPSPTTPPTSPPLPSSVPPSPTATPPASPAAEIGLEPFASGFDQLVLLTHAGDGSGQLFVVEQRGVVHVGGAAGAFVPEPFLDISERVGFGGERGLLGLAFHPDYAANGRLFVNYTDLAGDTVVGELARVEGCDCADPESERVLLTIDQPFPNHNGGMVAFGADGYLYVSTGDGGGGGDPLGAGQDTATLLGKILRLDVDATADGQPYAIPAGNPFADGEGGLPEIWDWGLRNPWRMSFDRTTGDLFIGDVGQGRWEEIDAEPAGSGGRNYGWNVMEGPECFAERACDQAGLTRPVSWYARAAGRCAVTGGYVYRGAAFPGLIGTYLFSDYCSGTVWGIDAATAVAGEPQEPRVLASSELNVTSFGEDEEGNVYLVSASGEIVRVVPAES